MKHISDIELELREAVAAGLLNPALADFIIGQGEAPVPNNVVHIATGRELSREECLSRANFSNPVDVARKAKNWKANGGRLRVAKLQLKDFPKEGVKL